MCSQGTPNYFTETNVSSIHHFRSCVGENGMTCLLADQHFQARDHPANVFGAECKHGRSVTTKFCFNPPAMDLLNGFNVPPRKRKHGDSTRHQGSEKGLRSQLFAQQEGSHFTHNFVLLSETMVAPLQKCDDNR